MSDFPKPAPVGSKPIVHATRVSKPVPTVGATSTPGKGSGNLGYRKTIAPVGENPKGKKLR